MELLPAAGCGLPQRKIRRGGDPPEFSARSGVELQVSPLVVNEDLVASMLWVKRTDLAVLGMNALVFPD